MVKSMGSGLSYIWVGTSALLVAGCVMLSKFFPFSTFISLIYKVQVMIAPTSYVYGEGNGTPL